MNGYQSRWIEVLRYQSNVHSFLSFSSLYSEVEQRKALEEELRKLRRKFREKEEKLQKR